MMNLLLGHQGHIQPVYYRLKAIWKQLMHLPKPAFLRKRRILEVVRFNDKVRRDMVADHFQPVALLVSKLPLSALLFP
jgi:hypothetical protein